MPRKRIAESLTARIFLITAGILLFAGAITFGFIAWATPSTYTAVVNDDLTAQVDDLVERLADTAPEDDYLIHFDPRDKRLARALLDSHKLVGWLLIAFGALIAYQNLIMNILGDLVYRWGHSSPVFRALYLVMDSLPDVVVCVVLIVCGVWLVKGPHPAKKPDASKDVPEDADFCEYHADEAAQPENAPLLSGPVVNENEVTDDDFDHEHDE